MESQAENKHYNRLQREKSPYLLQHAENPVDWYPWSTEAFEKAQKENKPVFLSIGYSTCHWCHVMAHESFEDPEVATLMNQAFISIKVDREERPDIDSIYMGVCQLMTGSGGWPLTIIMTPEKEPFFAATYIPKQRRLGMLGMIELIPRIQELWGTRRQEILESAGKITSILQQSLSDRSSDQFDAEGLQNLAFEQTKARFDSMNAGFGDAPKFPMAHTLSFLLRYWKRTHNEFALAMVERTLQAMRRGGIYDHIGFGFHRYSTDATWLVPHFEKMLYDQAMLAIAYIEAYQATGNELYRTIAREIFEYVLRDMTSTEGGFYSAEDADSEGIEGKFYVWNDKEILDILRDQAAAITRVFNVTGDGNFTEESTGQKTEVNIL
ncbi:MAG: thioredoxin domain-containing protein, partial [Chloroflexota bacterium]|nr:thioredoxin domain-containing protein [Chloroflexota bacterium]